MPFSSFLAFIRGQSKAKLNNVPTPTAKRQDNTPQTGWSDYDTQRTQQTKSTKTGPAAALRSVLVSRSNQTDDRDRSERRSRRDRSKSRTPNRARSLSRHSVKSLGRSLFGGPDADEDIPPMPRPVQQSLNTTSTSTEPTPGTAITTDSIESQPVERKSRRHSLARSLRSKKSWFGKSKDQENTAEVLASAMPGQAPQQSRPTTANIPAEQRRRRNSSVRSRSRRGSDASTIRPKLKKKSSFWASSNPDDSDSDVPPVPPLYRGGTPDSSSNSSSPNLEEEVQPAGVRPRPRRDDAISQPRPLSAVSTSSKKSYVPRSAAKGFARSTSVATDEVRQSFRQSFHLPDGESMVCLTEEQQIEWVRLMNGQGGKLQNDPPEQPEATQYKGKNRYSNAQALAALEAPPSPKFR